MRRRGKTGAKTKTVTIDRQTVRQSRKFLLETRCFALEMKMTCERGRGKEGGGANDRTNTKEKSE